MSVKLCPIDFCSQCVHFERDKVSFSTYCSKVLIKEGDKFRMMSLESGTTQIPSWCPLENAKNQ